MSKDTGLVTVAEVTQGWNINYVENPPSAPIGTKFVDRSQVEELLAAQAARIKVLSNEVVFGFYEEEYPMYAQGYNGAGGCELCDPITAQEANGLVDKIKALEAKLAAAEKEIQFFYEQEAGESL